jgi:hypothetical protein
LSLLGAATQSATPVGINCGPGPAGSNQQPFCAENNNFNGVVALGKPGAC